LYYYGARYLDPKYSMWISTDPALGEYIPKAPVDEEAKKYNQNLPGMGGVFNHINSNLWDNKVIKQTLKKVIKNIKPELLVMTETADAEWQITGAIYDFISQYETMKSENIIGNDHYNHAMANSRATQRGSYGKFAAKILSFFREATDVIRKGDTDLDIREDNIANRYGRSIPLNETPEEYNAQFDTRKGGHRANLKGIANDKTPQNVEDFLESYFTRDNYEN